MIRWQRRVFDVRRFLSPRLRARLRRLMGVGPLQEGRRFLPASGGRELFETLDRRKVNYVVLRWFEGLPDQADGDIDFLVADDALALFESLLSSDGEGIPCDLYSESAVPGYRYAGMAYFPAAIAQEILSRASTIPGPVKVPCIEDHFLSLAYHAIYQKGLRSGLRTSLRLRETAPPPMHDYHGTLTRLAEELALTVDISMEGLDEYLATKGWRPPTHCLARLAHHNPWLREHLRGNNGEGSGTAAPLVQVAS